MTSDINRDNIRLQNATQKGGEEMSRNKLELKTEGIIGSLKINGVDLSENVNGLDIKVRAGKLPEVTLHLVNDKTEIAISNCLIKNN